MFSQIENQNVLSESDVLDLMVGFIDSLGVWQRLSEPPAGSYNCSRLVLWKTQGRNGSDEMIYGIGLPTSQFSGRNLLVISGSSYSGSPSFTITSPAFNIINLGLNGPAGKLWAYASREHSAIVVKGSAGTIYQGLFVGQFRRFYRNNKALLKNAVAIGTTVIPCFPTTGLTGPLLITDGISTELILNYTLAAESITVTTPLTKSYKKWAKIGACPMAFANVDLGDPNKRVFVWTDKNGEVPNTSYNSGEFVLDNNAPNLVDGKFAMSQVYVYAGDGNKAPPTNESEITEFVGTLPYITEVGYNSNYGVLAGEDTITDQFGVQYRIFPFGTLPRWLALRKPS